MHPSLSLLFLALPLAAQPAAPKIDFIRDVKPLLAEKCHSCHGPDAQQAGLRLDTRQPAMRGGDYGPVILPGDSANSKLIKRIVNGDGGMQMPPTGALSSEEIGLLKAWVDQGADWRIDVKEEEAPKPVAPHVKAFISAVRGNDLKTVGRMLASDASLVDAVDYAGSTPLHHAAAFASVDMMKLLLAKGAKPAAMNRRKSMPLHWAAFDAARVKLLLEAGAPVDAKQVEGRTALYNAVSFGNASAAAALLLEKGADANARTANGATPLMAASTRGDVAVMRMLIDRKAQVNARNGAGATALINAAASGNAAAVKLLLDNGADAKLSTKKHDTALMAAATSGNEESVRLLIEAGSDVNEKGERGYTALMLAAASDALPAGSVKRLLAAGADTAPTADGETARSLAVKRGDTESARLLGASEQERKAGGVPASRNNTAKPVPEAVSQALALLETQSHNFIRIGGCNSCHAQDLPSVAAGFARQRGLRAPKSIAQLNDTQNGITPERLMDIGGPSPASLAWELFDSGVNGVAPNELTDTIVRYIKSMQTAQGNWRAVQGRRPPMNAGPEVAAALCIYSLQTYSRPSEREDSRRAIERAAQWLAADKPVTTQDHAFRLMGLVWAKANPAVIKEASKSLIALQRADGGWGQMPSMGTDAYASGEALYALHLAGVTPTDPVYRKGTDYLLRNQAADGSWHVMTRSIWLQPYFESGFPYAHDQWISAAGTAWASMALAATHEPVKVSQR
jgi:ankyrin repeat protein/mono/diheme cytochrome c family protein